MRKVIVLFAAIAVQCLVAGPGHAKQISVKLTQEQVKTTCGSLIVHTGTHMGCKKHCGEGKTCGFSCDKNGKNCKGVVVQMTATPPGSSGNPLQGGILDLGAAGFATQGPAAAGAPAAPKAPTTRAPTIY